MTLTDLPRWDLDSLFSTTDGPSVAGARERFDADLHRLGELFDRNNVRGGEPIDAGPAELVAFGEVFDAMNTFFEQLPRLRSYLFGVVAADARDDDATAEWSVLLARLASLSVLRTRFDAWVGSFGADALIEGSAQAADHAYPLRRAALQAEFQMSEAEEALAAELGLTGSSAWAKLHGDITSRLSADVDFGNGTESVPMAALRGMATAADAAARKTAYDAELAAWETVSIPLAAALNGAKGEANALNRRRGWADALEPALFINGVDRATLDAMTTAVVESLPTFHRFLHAKASWLGHDGPLPWWDMLAPVEIGAPSEVSWDQAKARVAEAFASYSPSLRGLAERAFTEQWIDAGPRDGKRGGAFCMSVGGDASRILMNFDGSVDSVQTLAHELGHAYHNAQMTERTPMQKRTPMALAETASIFCETVMVAAALDGAPDAAKLTMLDVDLSGATQVVVDIHSRFLFETALCAGREERTLSVDALCELMLDAQRASYGPGIRTDTLHPYMWAVKGHYFTPFYNWPYTFGLLFGLGLYADFLDEPDRFRSGYDNLLADTGVASAGELGARFGIDITDIGFWRASLGVIEGRIDDFIDLAARVPRS